MPLEVLQIILNFNSNITTYKEFFACSKTSFCNVSGLFFEFSPPSILGGRNFLNYIMFLMGKGNS
jgi:hypothetical protein